MNYSAEYTMNYSAHSQYSTNCDEKLVRHSTIYYILYSVDEYILHHA